MDGPPSYDAPYGWWGPGSRPASIPLARLVATGTLELPVAAFLAAAVRRRWSLAVVAAPSGAGKTTLLSALLPWLPPGTRRYYLRGGFEPFAFLDDPAAEPETSVLLCNEISPHLPIYLWGDGVARLLEARKRGFQIASTAHADGALGFVRLLTGPPLRVAADLVAGFDLVVALGLDAPGGDPRHRVTGIWRLRSGRPGTVEIIAVEKDRPAVLDLVFGSGAEAQFSTQHPVDDEAVAIAAAEIAASAVLEPAADSDSTGGPAGGPPDPPAPWRPRRDRPNG